MLITPQLDQTEVGLDTSNYGIKKTYVVSVELVTTSAIAKLLTTELILIFMLLSPAFAFFTKINRPPILATPSPSLPVSVISTVYSLPVSTGFESPKPLVFCLSLKSDRKIKHYNI